MSNGANNWNVSFSHIKWLETFLAGNGNVGSISRSQDIIFDVKRNQTGDSLRILCLNEYTMGQTAVLEALEEFGRIDIIYVGGGWNGYTQEAKDYCIQNKIGIYVTNEMTGALWKNEYWNYIKKSSTGESESFIK